MSGSILILGCTGQMGRALMALLGNRAVGLTRTDLDFSSSDFADRVAGHLDAYHFSAVINACAYTQVDRAQTDKAQAFYVNAEAVGILARACAKRHLPLVHYSTDYVFDGSGNTPWTESDTPSPLNVYGMSKWEGEKHIAEANGAHLIIRTSWVYDATGKNFFTTIRRALREKESLNVVDDQIGAPTYALHLARATLAALDTALAEKAFPSGLYHLCHSGQTSWHGFAQRILEGEAQSNGDITCSIIHPITTAQYPTPASRPLNSRLDCTRTKTVFGIALPDWKDGLQACFAELNM